MFGQGVSPFVAFDVVVASYPVEGGELGHCKSADAEPCGSCQGGVFLKRPTIEYVAN